MILLPEALQYVTCTASMLVTPYLADLAGHDSPMLHLKRQQADGMFDWFAFHAAELWEHGRPVSRWASADKESVISPHARP